jgi:hypothetical protein
LDSLAAQLSVKRLVQGVLFGGEHVFSTVIPENNHIAASAEFSATSTLRQKYGYAGQFDLYRALTKEIMEVL